MAVAANAKLPSPDLLLTVLSGPDTGVGYKLVGQTITLGRAPDNDVVLQDVKSSRNHAKIELRNGDYWFIDLGSQNGVLINGNHVTEKQLEVGDQILIGNKNLR